MRNLDRNSLYLFVIRIHFNTSIHPLDNIAPAITKTQFSALRFVVPTTVCIQCHWVMAITRTIIPINQPTANLFEKIPCLIKGIFSCLRFSASRIWPNNQVAKAAFLAAAYELPIWYCFSLLYRKNIVKNMILMSVRYYRFRKIMINIALIWNINYNLTTTTNWLRRQYLDFETDV